jgi:hypothetical protein
VGKVSDLALEGIRIDWRSSGHVGIFFGVVGGRKLGKWMSEALSVALHVSMCAMCALSAFLMRLGHGRGEWVMWGRFGGGKWEVQVSLW